MSLALLRTGCLSTLCFSNQLGGISAWMKVSETSILAWRKNQTDGCYARVPHASPCPEASLLKSDPVCSRNEPLFLNSNDQTGRSQSKQGSKKVFTDYCIPMGRTLCSKLAHVYSSPHLYKEGISIPILQLGKLRQLGQGHPGLEPRIAGLQSPRR